MSIDAAKEPESFLAGFITLCEHIIGRSHDPVAQEPSAI